MARKSRTEPVRELLEEAKKKILEKMYLSINIKDFLGAEVYNRFIEDILTPAIKLCGEEKPKEDKLDNR